MAFSFVGWLMLLGGVGMVVFGLVGDVDTEGLVALAIVGGVLALTGLIFVIAGRFVKSAGGVTELTDGVPGTAQVISVDDTGVTINHFNAVFRVQANITVHGQAPYVGSFKVTLGRSQWGIFQPGMTVPVLVERSDPSKIMLDPSRPVLAGVGGVPGGQGGGQTLSAADVIANGVASQAVLEVADPTGLTAGAVSAGLPPHEADDPLMRVVLTFAPTGMPERRNEVLIRVPDGKGHWLRPGQTLPIAYLAHDPSVSTIDWSRL